MTFVSNHVKSLRSLSVSFLFSFCFQDLSSETATFGKCLCSESLTTGPELRPGYLCDLKQAGSLGCHCNILQFVAIYCVFILLITASQCCILLKMKATVHVRTHVTLHPGKTNRWISLDSPGSCKHLPRLHTVRSTTHRNGSADVILLKHLGVLSRSARGLSVAQTTYSRLTMVDRWAKLPCFSTEFFAPQSGSRIRSKARSKSWPSQTTACTMQPLDRNTWDLYEIKK